MDEWNQFKSVATPEAIGKIMHQKLQAGFEAYEEWADWINARVELVRAGYTKDTSKLARVEQMAAPPPDHHPFAVLFQNADPVLLNRLTELDDGLGDVFSAANAYIRNLGILSKFWRFKFGRFIVSAVNLFESFLWPGRHQWRYEQFQEERDRYCNLLSSFRRDYLDDAARRGGLSSFPS